VTLRSYITDWSSVVGLPSHLFTLPDSFLDQIDVLDAGVKRSSDELEVQVVLAPRTPLQLALLHIRGVNLVFESEFSLGLIEGPTGLAASFGSGLVLELDSALLTPADATTFAPIAGTYRIEIGARVTATTDGDFSVAADALVLAPFAIGSTGVVIAPGRTVPCFTAEAATTASAAFPDAGVDASFRGVCVEAARVIMPAGFPIAELDLTGAFLGTGGFSGTSRIEFAETRSWFGLPLAISAVEVTFRQNALVAAAVTANMTLPFFGTSVGVTVRLSGSGAIAVEVDAPGTPLELGVLGTLALSALAVRVDGAAAEVELSGTLTLGIADLALPPVTFEGIRIRADGSFSTGTFALSACTTVDLFGSALDIDSISLGSVDRDGEAWRFVSFAGGVRLVEGLPAGLSTDGLVVRWREDLVAVELSGVTLAIEIPEVLRIDARLSLDLAAKRFAGEAHVAILPIGLQVDGTLVSGAGEQDGESFRYLQVELGVDFPVGIPLWATGVALFGVSGLVCVNMVPATEPGSGRVLSNPERGFDWYADWLEAWERPFVPQDGGVALGVGSTVGTLADDGHALNVRIALIVAVPGPLIVLHGVGNLLRPRSVLPESQLSAMILFDGASAKLIGDLGLDYALPADDPGRADVIAVTARAEAAFDFNDPSDWFVHLGEEAPERRIHAELLRLLQGDAWLEVDPSGVELGAGIGFDKTWDLEVVSVHAMARIEGTASITPRPPHTRATLALDGALELAAFGIELSLRVEADVAAEAPAPYAVTATLEIDVEMPWPFEPLHAEAELSWTSAGAPEPVAPILTGVIARTSITTETWTLSPTASAYDAAPPASAPSLPRDAFPTITFAHDLIDDAVLGVPHPTSSAELVGTTRFSYHLTHLAVQRWDGTSWTGDLAFVLPSGAASNRLDLGVTWQATGGACGRAVDLAGDGPFSFARAASRSTGSWSSFADAFTRGRPDWPIDLASHRFDAAPLAIGNVGAFLTVEELTLRGQAPSGTPGTLSVVAVGANATHAVSILGESALVLDFSEPADVTRLVLARIPGASSLSASVTFFDGTTKQQVVLLNVDLVTIEPAWLRVKRIQLTGFGGLVEVEWRVSRLTSEVELIESQVDAIASGASLLPENADLRIVVATETRIDGALSATEVRYAFWRATLPPDRLEPYVVARNPDAGARVYATHDLALRSKVGYLRELFPDGLEVEVCDANGASVDSAISLEWSDEVGLARAHVTPYLGAVAAAGLEIASSDEPIQSELRVRTDSGWPPGQRLHARISYLDRELDRWPFLTSRHASFGAAVAALTVETPRETVGTLTQLSLIAARVDLGRLSAAQAFDDVWYDVLGLGPPAASGWIARICDASSATIAIAFDLADPTDWARIELAIAQAGSTTAFVALHDPDGARSVLLAQPIDELAPWSPTQLDLTWSWSAQVADGLVVRKAGMRADEVARSSVA